MQSATITYYSSTIHFVYSGYGKRIVICFHGYGESANGFGFLMNQLPADEYTIVAIDLPFHGKTNWVNGLNFNSSDLKNITLEILSQITRFHENGSRPITLIGFSLGGRIALSLFEAIPEKVEKIVLLAPDGLKINFWYHLSTQTVPGNKLFAYTMKNPYWFFGFLKILNKMRMVNSSIYKFVHFYIDDAEVRKQLYQRWTSLRKLKPDIPRIKGFIKKYGVLVRLVYGRHDRIIIPARGKKFCRNIEPYCSLIVIESGHQVLHEKHAKDILQVLID